MEEEFVKDQKIREKTEEEKNKEILQNIIITRENLKQAHKNFEFAEKDLIDYYSYNIKAIQAKLDYLIKLAKSKGLAMDIQTQNQLDSMKEVS